MKNTKLNCESARNISIITVVEKMGIRIDKENKNEVWIKSPFRQERTASFKIDKHLNCWYDHGEGTGGNTLDFVIKYYNISPTEALRFLDNSIFSFHQQKNKPEETNTKNNKIIKLDKVSHTALTSYFSNRGIGVELANKYCSEFHQIRGDNRNFFYIAFRNDSGGIELRNKYYKGAFMKKDISTISNNSKSVYVFEGFFDFLSFLTLNPIQENKNDFIIMNSLSMINKLNKTLNNYTQISLFLDNDFAGKLATKKIIHQFTKAKDMSFIYNKYKDLNDLLLKNKNLSNDMNIGC